MGSRSSPSLEKSDTRNEPIQIVSLGKTHRDNRCECGSPHRQWRAKCRIEMPRRRSKREFFLTHPSLPRKNGFGRPQALALRQKSFRELERIGKQAVHESREKFPADTDTDIPKQIPPPAGDMGQSFVFARHEAGGWNGLSFARDRPCEPSHVVRYPYALVSHPVGIKECPKSAQSSEGDRG